MDFPHEFSNLHPRKDKGLFSQLKGNLKQRFSNITEYLVLIHVPLIILQLSIKFPLLVFLCAVSALRGTDTSYFSCPALNSVHICQRVITMPQSLQLGRILSLFHTHTHSHTHASTHAHMHTYMHARTWERLGWCVCSPQLQSEPLGVSECLPWLIPSVPTLCANLLALLGFRPVSHPLLTFHSLDPSLFSVPLLYLRFLFPKGESTHFLFVCLSFLFFF